MKIIHIIEASATGTLSMVVLLANAQVAAGHSVGIIYSERPETPNNFRSLFHKNITLLHIQMDGWKNKLLSLHKIRSKLSANKPEKVFMHSSFAGFLGRIASIGTLKKTRFFYIPHCISFMRKDVGMLKRIVFILFEWVASIKNADYIACSKSEQSSISASIPFRKCHLVENAIDFNVIPVVQSQTKVDVKTVITVGQIRPQKGPEQFAIIAASIKKIDPSLEFIWVGDGDIVSRGLLETAGVKVVGWIPKDNVWQYLQLSTIYLSTAKWEGMPVSLIEANMAGLPVIASSCAGNTDVIDHNKTGWLFNSTEEAVQQILFAVNNLDLASAQAKNAVAAARSRFSVDRYVEEMDSIV